MSDRQNILIIGAGGGREHTLAWKIAQSPKLGRLYAAPGNAGLADIATIIDLSPTDKPGLIEFAQVHDISLVIVASDPLLAAGMVDAFEAAGLRAFGPTQAAARIESSKVFSKELMTAQKIPTAKYKTFTDIDAAKAYVETHSVPLVVKANGLALGKGVYVCAGQAQANVALDEIMGNKIFGDSGSSVVIEEYMGGQEVSIQVLCDGNTTVMLPTSQDHKPVGTGDKGPNTGGMGTYAPVPWVTPVLLERIMSEVVNPALEGLKAAGSPFKGLLYPGLMINGDDIKVVEFNARFGDPEPQSYLRLLKSDLLDLLNACVDGTLADQTIEWSDGSAVCIILAAGGYPGKYVKGAPITGIEAAEALPGVVVFHAGTTVKNGKVVTDGGRVLGVSAIGQDLAEAQASAYAAAELIHFSGVQYRTDIGGKSLA